MDSVKNNHRALQWMSWATIISGFALFVILGYMLLWPITPITYLDERFNVSPLTVRAGDVMKVHLNYIKHVDYPANITMSFVDTVITDATRYQSLRKAGAHDHWRKVAVPNTLSPGIYFLVLKVDYQVNALRTITVRHRSVQFEIVE